MSFEKYGMRKSESLRTEEKETESLSPSLVWQGRAVRIRETAG